MKTSWNCTLFDQRTFHATCPHLIYVVKGFETCDVKGPTSIIHKVTTTMFGGKILNRLDSFEMWFIDS